METTQSLEERLQIERKRFQNLLDTASDAIVSLNSDQEILLFNLEAERLFGYTSQEIIGKPLSLLLPERYHATHQKHVERFGQENHDRRLMGKRSELIGLHKDGHEFPVEVSISKMTFENKTHFTAIVRDVTEKKKMLDSLEEINSQLEERVRQRTRELEMINNELRSFTYIVSHDLRTPLVNLKGFTGELEFAMETLRDICGKLQDRLTPNEKEALHDLMHSEIPESLQFIQSASCRMDEMVNAILKLSRLGYQELHLELVDTCRMVENIIASSLSHVLEKNKIKVTIEPLWSIVVDRVSLEQILGNLLDNAVKFLRKDVPGQIRIGSKKMEDGILFEVEDNGRGISDADMPKVFQIFRRAGDLDTMGEGMGLSYVQTLVRRHQGRIWCESEVGKGTTFFVFLPNQEKE